MDTALRNAMSVCLRENNIIPSAKNDEKLKKMWFMLVEMAECLSGLSVNNAQQNRLTQEENDDNTMIETISTLKRLGSKAKSVQRRNNTINVTFECGCNYHRQMPMSFTEYSPVERNMITHAELQTNNNSPEIYLPDSSHNTEYPREYIYEDVEDIHSSRQYCHIENADIPQGTVCVSYEDECYPLPSVTNYATIADHISLAQTFLEGDDEFPVDLTVNSQITEEEKTIWQKEENDLITCQEEAGNDDLETCPSMTFSDILSADNLRNLDLETIDQPLDLSERQSVLLVTRYFSNGSQENRNERSVTAVGMCSTYYSKNVSSTEDESESPSDAIISTESDSSSLTDTITSPVLRSKRIRRIKRCYCCSNDYPEFKKSRPTKKRKIQKNNLINA